MMPSRRENRETPVRARKRWGNLVAALRGGADRKPANQQNPKPKVFVPAQKQYLLTPSYLDAQTLANSGS
jgi:hypothetical protein